MSYRAVYWIDVEHEGLNLFRRIRGTDSYVVDQKAAALKALWDERWRKKQEMEGRKENIWNKKQQAIDKTKAAQEAVEDLKNILSHALLVNDAIDWEQLKKKDVFNELAPQKPPAVTMPSRPNEHDSSYCPPDWWSRFLAWPRKLSSKESFQQKFDEDLRKWEEVCRNLRLKIKEEEYVYLKATNEWARRKAAYPEEVRKINDAIEAQKNKYLKFDPNAIVDYCEMVLSNSQYPDLFPKDFELDYVPDNKTLIVEYQLPSLEEMPSLKEVKYIKSSDDFKESYLTESAQNKLYDDVIYMIALRSLHELFEADVIGALDAIVFNGWVKSVDKGTGQQIQPCILSMQVVRDEFLKINLHDVDPKECFRKLKGIGSSKLHGLAAIAPIMQIDKEDKRFVVPYAVADGLNGATNLAAIDWQDFENLIREIFEKEFSINGGEVKITRASRDEGVDAVAFDPDPVRGGKIIIQAKRYTNTVGVSAVRDLYGTVMNEGAMKGILVTTSDYGPDAYKFVQDKPLTLLNGSNLLHLLEKHGHRARIDLGEAKKIIAEQNGNH